MKHLHEPYTDAELDAEIEAEQQRIAEFAQDFVDLWLSKYRDLERYGLLQVLIELILNPQARYYKLADKERDSWLLCAIALLCVGLKDSSQVRFTKSAQIEALYRLAVEFDDDELCEDCKRDVRKAVESMVKEAESRANKPKWWKRNKNKKPKDYGNQQYGATECPSMTE